MICWIQGLKWFCFWLSIGPSSSVRVQGAWVWEPLWRAGKFRRLWLHVTNPETWGWGPGLATCQVVKWWEQWEAGALPFPADWPSVSVITSLSLYFFICKMGTLLLTRQNWRVSRDRHVLGCPLLIIGAWQVAVVFTTGGDKCFLSSGLESYLPTNISCAPAVCWGQCAEHTMLLPLWCLISRGGNGLYTRKCIL